MKIDESRADHEALRIDESSGLLGFYSANRNDFFSEDANVRLIPGIPRAIKDTPILDNDIVCDDLPPFSRLGVIFLPFSEQGSYQELSDITSRKYVV
jgi:hypothetical protein